MGRGRVGEGLWLEEGEALIVWIFSNNKRNVYSEGPERSGWEELNQHKQSFGRKLASE